MKADACILVSFLLRKPSHIGFHCEGRLVCVQATNRCSASPFRGNLALLAPPFPLLAVWATILGPCARLPRPPKSVRERAPTVCPPQGSKPIQQERLPERM